MDGFTAGESHCCSQNVHLETAPAGEMHGPRKQTAGNSVWEEQIIRFAFWAPSFDFLKYILMPLGQSFLALKFKYGLLRLKSHCE